MVNVYAPQDFAAKKEIWSILSSFKVENEGLYFIFSDFNAMREDSKRLGSIFFHQIASSFNDFIGHIGLVEVLTNGKRFTRI